VPGWDPVELEGPEWLDGEKNLVTKQPETYDGGHINGAAISSRLQYSFGLVNDFSVTLNFDPCWFFVT